MIRPEPTTGDKVAAQRAKLKELHDQLAAQVTAVTEGTDWKAWLDVAARFRSYSWHNTMLIFAQWPEASRVAGYREWQRLGRQVTKGEKGIKIIAPIFRRVKQENDPTHPEAKVGRDSDDGDDHQQETNRAKKLVGYTVVHVWDESQTTGDPLPEAPTPQLLQGAAPDGLWEALATQVAAAGFTLERGECGGPDGWTNFRSRVVRVRDDIDDAHAVKTLAHELAHTLMHDPTTDTDEATETDTPTCRGVREVEADSVAYLICELAGMDTDQDTFPYVATWAFTADDDPAKVVEATGRRVLKTTQQITVQVPDHVVTPSAVAPRKENCPDVDRAVVTDRRLVHSGSSSVVNDRSL